MDIDMLYFGLTKRGIERQVFATWKQGVMTSWAWTSFMRSMLYSESSDQSDSARSWLAPSTELHFILAVEKKKREVCLWRCALATRVHICRFLLRNSPQSKVKQSHRRRSVRVFSHEVIWQREFVPAISRKRVLAAIKFTHAVNHLFIPLHCVCVCACVCAAPPPLAYSSLWICCVCVLELMSVCIYICADEEEKEWAFERLKHGID